MTELKRTFISISQGKQAGVRVLYELVLESGAFYVTDRGHVDFQRLYCFVLACAFFVTRAKTNLNSTVWNRARSIPPPECAAIKSSGGAILRASNLTRTSCDASIMWTRKQARAWSF